MPQSVSLRFIPPDIENLVSMKIWEGPTATDPMTMIETVSSLGTFPNYIDHYTTDLAASRTDWFALSWVDDKGAETDLSVPVQGGTETLIGEVISRVIHRDPTLNEHVVQHEAEAVIQEYFGINSNPYDPALVASYRVKSGLASLTLARVYIMRLVQNAQANKWVAGLVSMDTSNTSQSTVDKAIDRLIALANTDLNRNYSAVLLLEDIKVAGGFNMEQSQITQITGVDITRGALVVSID